MASCAPNRSLNDWSCFTLEELQVMAQAWNNTVLGKDYPIIFENHGKIERKTLWSELKSRFLPFCGNDESCWLDNKELNNELQKISKNLYKAITYFTLKPKGTKGKHDWLSTNEIDLVMKQYEFLHKDHFRYIGCFASDYYKLYPDKFPYEALRNFEHSALIFNLDESHQSGSHWVVIFFENTQKNLVIEYFDATGNPPNKNIKEFLQHPYLANAEYIENTTEHQKGNNECGMFSMFYVLERLKGKSVSQINKKRITDRSMNEFRKELFRPKTKSFSFI